MKMSKGYIINAKDEIELVEYRKVEYWEHGLAHCSVVAFADNTRALGAAIFATREEAEAMLAEMKANY